MPGASRTGRIPGEEVGLPTGANQRSSEGEQDGRRWDSTMDRREAMQDEDGGQSVPSRVHRATGKTEEGAGNDQGPAAMTHR